MNNESINDIDNVDLSVEEHGSSTENTPNINMEEELSRRNIKLLNVNVNLEDKNIPVLTFGNLDYPNIKNVELISTGFKYDNFTERCKNKFIDILPKKTEGDSDSLETTQDKETRDTGESSPVVTEPKWDKGKWDKEKGTLTLNRSFDKAGIYTGVIRVHKEYDHEDYVVSFRKLPSDYLYYKIKENKVDASIITKPTEQPEPQPPSQPHHPPAEGEADLLKYGVEAVIGDGVDGAPGGVPEGGSGESVQGSPNGSGGDTGQGGQTGDTGPGQPGSSGGASGGTGTEPDAGPDAGPDVGSGNGGAGGSVPGPGGAGSDGGQGQGQGPEGPGSGNGDTGAPGEDGTGDEEVSNPQVTEYKGITIEDINVLGYGEYLDINKLDDILVSCNGSEPISLKNESKLEDICGKERLTDTGESAPKEEYKCYGINLSEHHDFKLEEHNRITLTAKYSGAYEVSSDILLVKKDNTAENNTGGSQVRGEDESTENNQDNIVIYVKSPKTTTSAVLGNAVDTSKTEKKITIVFLTDTLKGYNVTPLIHQYSPSKFKVIFKNLKDIFKTQEGKLDEAKLKELAFEFNENLVKYEDQPVEMYEVDNQNDIIFDIELENAIENDVDWYFTYGDKFISSGTYVLPKVEAINLEEFKIKDGSTTQRETQSDVNNKEKLDVTLKFENIEGDVALEKYDKNTNTDHGASTFTLQEDGKNIELDKVDLDKVTIEDIDKIVTSRLEIKDKNICSDGSNSDNEEGGGSPQDGSVREKSLTSNLRDGNQAVGEGEQPESETEEEQEKPTKPTKKYQGTYRAGIIVEKLDFLLNLSHRMGVNNSVILTINPRFFEDKNKVKNGSDDSGTSGETDGSTNDSDSTQTSGFDKTKITSGTVYYKKSSERLWNKDNKAEVTLDENKNGTATVYNLQPDTKYDFITVYVYDKTKVEGEEGAIQRDNAQVKPPKENKKTVNSKIITIETLPPVTSNGGVEIVDPNELANRVPVIDNNVGNDTTIDIGGGSNGVVGGGDNLELKLPSNISYDNTKQPEASNFSYVDKNGKVVTQKKEDFENVKVKFEGDKLKVEGLVPGKKYDKLELKYVDKDGKVKTLSLENVKIEPESESEKYLSNVYDKMFDRPADEKGYHYHLDNLKKGEVGLRDFLMNTITQKEFSEVHKTTDSKIEALYGSIVGREADEQGKDFWKKEYDKIVLEGKNESEAIKALADRMVNENELKEVANKINVKW